MMVVPGHPEGRFLPESFSRSGQTFRMSISLLHVSDIHPQVTDDLTQLAVGISNAVVAYRSTPYYLVASGDLGLKGSNHRLAGDFLRQVADRLGIPRGNIVCVPGNHDIQTDRLNSPFQEYSQAVYRATGDSRLTRVERASVHKSGEIEFLLINSAYHLDPGFGMVDCGAVRSAISSLSPDSTRIAVVHHHQIPIEANDRSTIVNAYELLTILSSNGFAAVLHGHQHVSLSMTIGPTKLIGVGTLNFPPGRNINNQFNLVDIGSRVTRFFYHADSSTSTGFGNWDPREFS
jgi:predicted phosphodiesterase